MLESNQPEQAYETYERTSTLTRNNMVGLTGFEPVSNWLRARYNCRYTIDP